MFRPHIGALALVAALAMPLAASAQTQTYPAPGNVSPGTVSPGAPGAAPSTRQGGQQFGERRHRDRNPYFRAMRSLNLSDAQRQQIQTIMRNSQEAMRRQIDGVLTPDQRAQLRSQLSQTRRPQ